MDFRLYKVAFGDLGNTRMITQKILRVIVCNIICCRVCSSSALIDLMEISTWTTKSCLRSLGQLLLVGILRSRRALAEATHDLQFNVNNSIVLLVSHLQLKRRNLHLAWRSRQWTQGLLKFDALFMQWKTRIPTWLGESFYPSVLKLVSCSDDCAVTSLTRELCSSAPSVEAGLRAIAGRN